MNRFNPELQLKETESAIKITKQEKTETDAETKYHPYYSNSKSEIITNGTDIDYTFKSIYSTITSKIQKSLGKGLSSIVDSVIDHTINISKDKPLSRSNCIKLPKKLDHPKIYSK